MSLTDLTAAPPATAAGPKAHVVGTVDEVPPGEGRAFVAGDTQVAVFRLRDGSLHATQAACVACRDPSRNRKIASWVPATANARPSPGGTSSTMPTV